MYGGRQRSGWGHYSESGSLVQLTVGIVFMLWPMPCAHQQDTQLEGGGRKVQLDDGLLNVYPVLVVFIVEQARRSTDLISQRVKARSAKPHKQGTGTDSKERLVRMLDGDHSASSKLWMPSFSRMALL